MKEETHPVFQSIHQRYREKSAQSREQHQRALNRLPGGDTRGATHFSPYPLYMQRGRGCTLTDLDGNHYLDLLNNYSSLVHGHAHPRVMESARQELERGTVFGAPSEMQILHAEHLCDRVSSLDQLRYCNSGTEATLFALRAARAFTGRDRVIKIDGGYHGTHDHAEVSVHATTDLEQMHQSRLNTRGVPRSVLSEIDVVPFNNLDAVKQRLKRNHEQTAALIVEPILGAGGVVPAAEGYLQGLRELTQRYGVLLIFDEVLSFRMHQGGMQDLVGVRPDLTAFGKIIGGGLAVGAFGGNQQIMKIFAPDQPQYIFHSGTFNGNHLTMAAGLMTMELYDTDEIERLNRMGDKMRKGIDEAFRSRGLQGQATGVGSVIGIHWTEDEIVNAGDVVLAQERSGQLTKLLHLELINRGIFSSSRGLLILSTPMGETEIEQLLTAFGESLDTLQPFVRDCHPQLNSL